MKNMSEATTTIVKLSEIEFGSKVIIGGFDFKFKGYERRKVKEFGIQEHFVFYCDETGVEKIFGKFKFYSVKIKKVTTKKEVYYEWK